MIQVGLVRMSSNFTDADYGLPKRVPHHWVVANTAEDEPLGVVAIPANLQDGFTHAVYRPECTCRDGIEDESAWDEALDARMCEQDESVMWALEEFEG